MIFRSYHKPTGKFLFTDLEKGILTYGKSDLVKGGVPIIELREYDFENDQQLVGFTKDRKPIYEGDIVLYQQAGGGILPSCNKTHTCYIKREGRLGGFDCYDLNREGASFGFHSNCLTVIGHRYEEKWRGIVGAFEAKVWK